MAVVSSLTKERMLAIEASSVVDGAVDEFGNLILTTHGGTEIDAGHVVGATGAPGDQGPQGTSVPIIAGIIQEFAGSVPPSGWLFCNGAAISRTTYSALFTAIGTTYGVGDGSTTFNLPDRRGRVAVGLDPSQTEFDNLGEKGGAKTHTLTVPEIPAHQHQEVFSTHAIAAGGGSTLGGLTGSGGNSSGVAQQYTGLTGGGGAHNNLQPYEVTNFIISIGINGESGGGSPIEVQYNLRGSSAERDALFGIPGSDTQRVLLANQKINWYNTDYGWTEMYYAVNGLSGLVSPALVTGIPSGWYPVSGELPYAVYEPTTAFNATASNYVGNWHNGNKKRKGGDAWFEALSSGFVTIKKAGRYDIEVWTLLTSGTGTANFHLRVLNNGLTTVEKQVDGLAFTLHSTLAVRLHVEYRDAVILEGKQAGLFCHSGNLEVHTLTHDPRAQFSIRYRGPALVTD